MTGQTPTVEIAIYPSFGIDDLGTCVDYLVDEGWWKKQKQTIVAPELDLKATREKLIEHIEAQGLTKELQSLVGKCWKEILKESALHRKNRYAQDAPAE